MIYVTGDTHGLIERFQNNSMNDQTWTENDYLIICGDFGFISNNDEIKTKNLDFLSTKPYTICFCDGNHEAFPVINSYPQEEWNGGQVHHIRDNIFHLMRGQVFEIQGKKIFTFGGAYSIDRYRHQEGVSWWREEQPSEEEFAIGLENLKKHDFKVDYIITHTASLEMIKELIARQPWDLRSSFEMNYRDHKTMGYLGEFEFKTEYRHWYFGHWHLDTLISDKWTAVYFDVYTME